MDTFIFLSSSCNKEVVRRGIYCLTSFAVIKVDSSMLLDFYFLVVASSSTVAERSVMTFGSRD